jgi:hypothetical protein
MWSYRTYPHRLHDLSSLLILQYGSIRSYFQQHLVDRGMQACHDPIADMLVLRVSGDLGVMGSINVGDHQVCRWISIAVAGAQLPELSSHEQNGFTDFA